MSILCTITTLGTVYYSTIRDIGDVSSEEAVGSAFSTCYYNLNYSYNKLEQLLFKGQLQ